MRVDESRNSRSRLTTNSHQLSCTLINFELVQILVRVNERFGPFDRSWELHESRRELQKQAISKSLPIRRRRKKENIVTYHRKVTVGVMTRTVSSLTSVKKRRKRSGEATSKNKEIEKRRKTLVNSHATLTARLTEQWELRKHSCKLSPANSHRLALILVWSRLKSSPWHNMLDPNTVLGRYPSTQCNHPAKKRKTKIR